MANIGDNISGRRTSTSYSLTTPSCMIHIQHLRRQGDLIPTRYLRPSSLRQDSDWRCLLQRKAIRHTKQHNYIVGSSSMDLQKVCSIRPLTSLMQLVSTVATDLKFPTGVSPPYSHQSQGKVERFHRNLFDQLRTTRLQWSKDLNMLPPESLPWALHHSIFILNNYLVHSSGKTSHFENYRYNYHSNIVHFGEMERLFLETSGTFPRRSYVPGINIRNFVASGLDVTSSRMSTSLHYLCTTANIHLQLLVLTGAD